MSAKYSVEWLRALIAEKHARRLDHHDCCICGRMVCFRIWKDGDVIVFDSNCNCVSYESTPRESSLQEIADWLAQQSSDEIRDAIMRGLK